MKAEKMSELQKHAWQSEQNMRGSSSHERFAWFIFGHPIYTMALSAVANFFDTEADKYYLSHELSGKIHDPKINITTIKETDVASAHFALGCLKRTTMYDSLLAAARPLARKLLRAGEPGVFINPQNIQLQITAPMVELREFVTAEFIEEAQCRQPGEQVPFHVTMELVALLQLLCERDELVKEDSALSSCKSDPDADADAAAATAAALAATSRAVSPSGLEQDARARHRRNGPGRPGGGAPAHRIGCDGNRDGTRR